MDTIETDDNAKPATPTPAKQDKAAAAKAEAVDALVEQWIATLRGGAIARHTPAWNELTSSLPALKAAIIEQGA